MVRNDDFSKHLIALGPAYARSEQKWTRRLHETQDDITRRQLAVAMSTHPRLGAGSSLGQIAEVHPKAAELAGLPMAAHTPHTPHTGLYTQHQYGLG